MIITQKITDALRIMLKCAQSKLRKHGKGDLAILLTERPAGLYAKEDMKWRWN